MYLTDHEHHVHKKRTACPGRQKDGARKKKDASSGMTQRRKAREKER